jgi:hypothetical protein
MRTLILIAGLVLASATAQAGDNRSLSLAGSDAPTTSAPAKSTAPAAPQTAEAPQAAETPKAGAPKYIERPAIVEPKQAAPKAEPSYGESAKESARESSRPVAERTDAAPRAAKPRKKRYWSETRIINELHRHGIYW